MIWATTCLTPTGGLLDKGVLIQSHRIKFLLRLEFQPLGLGECGFHRK